MDKPEMHVDEERRVTIPEFIVDFLGWKSGDVVVSEIHSGGTLVLTRQSAKKD